jgi:CRISPR-associated endoribonuclease Cas6
LRLKLTLCAPDNGMVPFNYNYPLSSSIYSLLRFGSPEFSAFLHDIGYKLNGKVYKLFTFALKFERFSIKQTGIHILSPNAYLYISSPFIDDFIRNFIIGTFESQHIVIADLHYSTLFRIKNAELIPAPVFMEKMKFMLLSPLVLSTRRERQGEMRQYYLRPEDGDDINRIITLNTRNKFQIMYGKENTSALRLSWDEGYLKKNRRVTKKVTIDENGQYPIDIIGMQAPFTLEGEPELIRVGYECGFGEKNAMGFGMVDLIQ